MAEQKDRNRNGKRADRSQTEREFKGFEDIIAGRNPCMEALRSGQNIEQIFVSAGERNGSLPGILKLAKDRGIPIKEVHPAKLKSLCGNENHQKNCWQRSPREKG